LCLPFMDIPNLQNLSVRLEAQLLDGYPQIMQFLDKWLSPTGTFLKLQEFSFFHDCTVGNKYPFTWPILDNFLAKAPVLQYLTIDDPQFRPLGYDWITRPRELIDAPLNPFESMPPLREVKFSGLKGVDLDYLESFFTHLQTSAAWPTLKQLHILGVRDWDEAQVRRLQETAEGKVVVIERWAPG